jgi:beta-galactosidase
MDANWLFSLGDLTNAEASNFDDQHWRHLDIPHDWSIEGSFSETNRTGGAGAFLPAGVGWYRKHFVLPPGPPGARVFVEFDGVMANSDVWINGFHLGHRPYGYVSFLCDLTDHLNREGKADNVLAVRADNSREPASRWYAGAGIYRHVRLILSNPVHIENASTFIRPSKVSSKEAVIHIQSTVQNDSGTDRSVILHFGIVSPLGKIVCSGETAPQKLSAGKTAAFEQEFTLSNPGLWDLDHPNIYRLATTVADISSIRPSSSISGTSALDEESISFGIREARFEPETGFWLNGKNLKIKGVCLHHDGGGVGAAVPLAIWERRLLRLKEIGCNAVRTAHNPPAPEFLDLCDRLGFLVMDEMFDCWTVGKNPYDYHLYFKEWSKIDARDTVRRDRNHPCIVVYSAGNEIHDTPKAELAKQILGELVQVFHENDPSRPVSQALFRPNVSHDYDNGLADMLDVVGQNYRENEILAAHRDKPSRKILGTENGHDRGVWLALRDNAPYAGQFLWSGIDYLGESRRWPVIGAGSGLLDRTGNLKPRAFERQSWWSDKPMVYLVRRIEPERATPNDPGFEPLARRQFQFADWTPRVLDPHQEQVEVYSNCEEVELFLNQASLGSKSLPRDASPRVWKIAFAPGALRAVGKNHGKTAATHELQTAGKANRLVLSVEHSKLTSGWDNVCHVEVSITDAAKVVVPDASHLINFQLSGPARIIAVDNADNSSHEPFQANSRHAYQGRCLVILKATGEPGKIKLTASGDGLSPTSVEIKAAPSESIRR